MKIKAFLTSLGVALGTCFANAHAGDSPALARVGIGAFDIMDKGFAWEVDANYRFDSEFWIFNPQIGALYTGNGDKYGYGGIVWDIPLSKKWHFNASTAAGYYSKGGTDGKDLGGPIEFRTGYRPRGLPHLQRGHLQEEPWRGNRSADLRRPHRLLHEVIPILSFTALAMTCAALSGVGVHSVSASPSG